MDGNDNSNFISCPCFLSYENESTPLTCKSNRSNNYSNNLTIGMLATIIAPAALVIAVAIGVGLFIAGDIDAL